MLRIQILDTNIHDRKGFDCGVVELNDYLNKTASSSALRSLSKTYVLIETDRPAEIIGYYTFSFAAVTAPPNSKLKNYPHVVPAIKLGRLAVARLHQGKSFGEQLLLHTIEKTASLDRDGSLPPVIGLFVDAKNGAEKFYLKYGFIPAETDGAQKLWLPMHTCVQVSQV